MKEINNDTGNNNDRTNADYPFAGFAVHAAKL